MKNTIKTIITLLFLGLSLVSCNNSQSKNIEPDAHEDHGPEGSVSLNELQMKTLDLKIIHLEKRNMSQEIQVNGNLELPPQEKADISPLMGGIVKQIYVIEGDKVKKGKVLATMQHPDFIQLQEDYVIAIQDYNYLKEEYIRNKKLHEEKVTSTNQFQKITSEYNKKKMILQSFEIKLKMIGMNPERIKNGHIYPLINITSPFNGTVSLVETNVGAFAAPMTKLFEVVNNSKLHADFMVYEKDINKIKVGQKIFFHTSSVEGHEFEAEIHNISPVFEENPKALHVHADIVNKTNELIPGMYINGRILANDSEETVVPNDAIVAEGEKYYIFVKTKDHAHSENAENHVKKTTFVMVEIIKGVTNAGFTAIRLLNDFPSEIEIAGNAAYFLLAEMKKEENEHHH